MSCIIILKIIKISLTILSIVILNTVQINNFSERTGCAMGEYDTGRVVSDKKSFTFPNEGQVITLRVRDAIPV